MADRKQDHIELAFKSQTNSDIQDDRFVYEPALSGHPKKILSEFSFLDKTLRTPIWASSMTGGTELARKINENIARVCRDFGMGMGLGSCRIILDNDEYLNDFNVRSIIGYELPLFANLGISQIEKLIIGNNTEAIKRLIDKLQADGLIVHVNPLQEWFQPEGTFLSQAPVDIIEKLLDRVEFPIIVKEVGQGMGTQSLMRLMKLPLRAIEFGAFGGTNFSLVELLRNDKEKFEAYRPLIHIGQSAEQMIDSVNSICNGTDIKCKEIIVSGGIKSFLDGYYFMKKSQLPAIYGQASAILRYAKISYDELYKYIQYQAEGLALAESFLRINPAHL